MNKQRLIKIKSGYHGNHDEYQFGERVFVIARGGPPMYICAYERPKINQGQAIFTQSTAYYRPFMKAFKQFLLNNQTPQQ